MYFVFIVDVKYLFCNLIFEKDKIFVRIENCLGWIFFYMFKCKGM